MVTHPQSSYLSQMKSDLHETFSVSSDWSPKLINNVCGRARAHVHAQHVKTCMQFGLLDTSQFLSQMNLDFHETWYNHGRGIEDALNKIWEQYVHAHARNVRKHAQFDTPQFLRQMNSDFHET